MEMSNLELVGLAFLLVVLGFGLGVAYWSYVKPVEKVYAGNDYNPSDLLVYPSPSDLASDMGSGRNWNSNSPDGSQDHLDSRGADSITVSGPASARTGS